MKTGRLQNNCSHGRNNLGLGKIYLSPVKIGLASEKQRQIETTPLPPLLSQAQLYSFIFDSSASVMPQAAQEKANGGCGQSVTAPFCLFFPCTLLPCFSIGPLHRLQSFRINLLWPGVFHRLQYGCLLCCGLSMGCRVMPDSTSPLQGLQGFPGAPLSLMWVLAGLFLTVFPSLLGSVLPFLTYVFPEAPPSWLRASALPCLGSVGASERSLCSSPLPALGHLHFT